MASFVQLLYVAALTARFSDSPYQAPSAEVSHFGCNRV